MRFIPLAFLFLGATYYVDPAGSDLNSGSIGSPFATWQKASDTAQTAGDIVCFNNGTYTPGATTTRYTGSGTEGNPVIFRNCQGGTVLIDPSTHITGWTLIGTNLYEANNGTVGAGTYLWKDTTWWGKSKTNSQCSQVDTDGEWCVSSNARAQVYSSTDPALATWRIARTAFQGWDISYIEFDGLNIQWANFSYHIGYSGSGTPIPTTQTHHITIRDSAIAYVGSRGIRFIGSILYPTHHVYIENTTVHSAHETSTSNGHCIKFDSNDDGYHNSYGYVTNSTVYNCEATGIQFSDGWQHAYFSGNTAHDTSQREDGTYSAIRCGDVFYCYMWDNTAYGGTIPYGSGITTTEKADPAYVYNNISTGFNFYGFFVAKQVKNPTNINLYNNIAANNDGGGIYIADTNNCTVYNNTLYNNGNNQLNASTRNTNCTVKNNVILATVSPKVALIYNSGQVTASHNLMKSTNTNIVTYDGVTYNLANYEAASGSTGNINADPVFVSNGVDYHLQVTSPAINAGTWLGYDYDFDYDDAARPQGRGWDMGAYEYTIPDYGMKNGARLKGGAKLK